MGKTVVEKILATHIVDGELTPGTEIGLRIDQTLTQDATGTTAFLLLEAMGVDEVKAETAVSYIDHNMAQFGPENHNDHLYLQSVANKFGANLSRPGNGICHQVHFERFATPGKTLIGSDSHTPTGGGMGMIAMGAGGLDVAVAMGGGAFYTTCPRVIGVELVGKLRPWVAPKDIILRLLSILTTRGNVGCMVEYFGEGLASLPAPARATCTNMGAELGVTTSVFPSDEQTQAFLEAQGRGDDFVELKADECVTYGPIEKHLDPVADAAALAKIQEHGTDVTVGEPDGEGKVPVRFGHIVIDLSTLEPLTSESPSPENIREMTDVGGLKVNQVLIGSCTNSSYQDLMLVSQALKGKTVHPSVELGIAPGSKQVMTMLAQNGALADLIASGARIVESGCGPCIGQGFSPAENIVSLRTFNRNFAGRSGTKGDRVFLVSPETAVASALTGEITNPRTLGDSCPQIDMPSEFLVDDNMIQRPMCAEERAKIEIVRGSTIVKPPAGDKLPDTLTGKVAIKVGDKITTDHIMPAGSLLKYRSNVPVYGLHVFDCFNEEGQPTFAERCLELKEQGVASIIVAGDSYGQGSSREHAALCPMYLGVQVVIAREVERIHQANLVNFAILPLSFVDASDYDNIEAGDELTIEGTTAAIAEQETVAVKNVTQGTEFECKVNLAPRQRAILGAGGLLTYTREQA